MKNKKSFWLAVATLVLCIGVMVTGIYAVMSAKLQLGGTLGFNMHNALVEVSGSIQNVAELQKDNSYKNTTKTISNAIMGGTSETITSLNLGNLEFYKGTNMIFNLSFKNIGETSIIANFSLDYDDTKFTEVDTNLKQEKTGSIISIGGITTLRFELKMINETQTDGLRFEIIAEFEEFALGFDETHGNYIAMGKDPTSQQEVRWFPFAYSSDGTTFTPHSLSTEKLTSGTYYFISEYILIGHTQWGPYGSEENNYGLDYGTSLIYEQVDGKGESSVYSIYGMKDYLVYNAIKSRTLPGEIYTFGNGAGSYTTKECVASHFWLLSSKYPNESASEISFLASNSAASPISIKSTIIDGSVGGSWWLRSPYKAETVYSYLRNISNNGTIAYSDSNTSILSPGIRPAFQITIG